MLVVLVVESKRSQLRPRLTSAQTSDLCPRLFLSGLDQTPYQSRPRLDSDPTTEPKRAGDSEWTGYSICKNVSGNETCKLKEQLKMSYLQRKYQGFTDSKGSSVTALLVAPTLSLQAHWAASTVS